jgi:hypothetical protein
MTAYWARSPFPAAVPLDRIDLGHESLGSGGEASAVHRLAPPHGDWVFKRYVASVPSPQLAGLIAHPENFTAHEIELINRHTAWPVARVEERPGRSIGVIMPAAPEQYWTCLQLPRGRKERRLLAVDLLTREATRQRQLGLPGQTLSDRLAVCVSIVTVAALLEHAGLTYLDWSLANVLWSVNDHTAYLIDIDGVTFGPRPQIGTHMFEDPLVPMKAIAGVEVDRYRVALLVAWCLTGTMPDPVRMRASVNALAAEPGLAAIAALLNRTLDAARLGERVSLDQLRDALLAAAVRQSDPLKVPSVDIAHGPATINWRPIVGERPNPGAVPSRPHVPAPVGSPILRSTETVSALAHSPVRGTRTLPVLAICIVLGLMLLTILFISQLSG